MEKYFEGEELTVAEIKKTIRKATCDGNMVPICCGTSYRNKGVQPLLDAVVDYMPAPTDVESIKGINPDTDEEEYRHSSDSEPFSALAFNLRQAHRFITLLRVIEKEWVVFFRCTQTTEKTLMKFSRATLLQLLV